MLHDGKILLVGGTYEAAEVKDDYDLVLAQYNKPDGSVDATFGDGGKLTSDLGAVPSPESTRESPYKYEHAQHRRGELVQEIIVAGDIGGPLPGGIGQQDFFVARYNADGKSGDATGLDPTFGTNGLVVTDAGPYDLNVANAVAIQSGDGEKWSRLGMPEPTEGSPWPATTMMEAKSNLGRNLSGGEGQPRRHRGHADPRQGRVRSCPGSERRQDCGRGLGVEYPSPGNVSPDVIAVARYNTDGESRFHLRPRGAVAVDQRRAQVRLRGETGSTTAVIVTVTLSNAITSNVTVNYATANGTATGGSDYVGRPAAL